MQLEMGIFNKPRSNSCQPNTNIVQIFQFENGIVWVSMRKLQHQCFLQFKIVSHIFKEGGGPRKWSTILFHYTQLARQKEVQQRQWAVAWLRRDQSPQIPIGCRLLSFFTLWSFLCSLLYRGIYSKLNSKAPSETLFLESRFVQRLNKHKALYNPEMRRKKVRQNLRYCNKNKVSIFCSSDKYINRVICFTYLLTIIYSAAKK